MTTNIYENNRNELAEMYDKNFDVWLSNQIFLLRAGRIHEVDITHLIQELEDMGKSNVRELESRFLVLIAHLLKWQFQFVQLKAQRKEFKGKSWRNTIIEQRIQIAFLLDEVPSLKNSLKSIVNKVYLQSLKLAIKQTGLAESVFPQNCPYTIEQLLDDEFYP